MTGCALARDGRGQHVWLPRVHCEAAFAFSSEFWPAPAAHASTAERIRRPFDQPTIPQGGPLTRGGQRFFGHSVAIGQQRRQVGHTRRKRAGVEPTRSRLGAAPTGFEGRLAHRSRFSSISESIGPHNWATNASSSDGSRHRQSSQRRPSASLPTTGRGNPRNHADSASNALPPTVTAHEGNRSTGNAPEPIWLRQGSTATGRSGHNTRNRSATRSAVALIASVGRVSNRRVGSSAARRSGVQVEQQYVFQVAASRALSSRKARVLSGLAFRRLINSRATDHEASLRTAEQFVAREAHEVGTGRQRFLRHRLLMRAALADGQIDQAAAAQILHHRQFSRVGDRRQSRPPWRGGY